MKKLDLNFIIFTFLLSAFVAMFSGALGQFVFNTFGQKTTTARGFVIDTSTSSVMQTQPADLNAKVVNLGALFAKANTENGQKVAKTCAMCHTFDKGGRSKVGPNLWNVMGSKINKKNGFVYSNAMIKLSEKSPNWTLANMFTFINAPSKFLSGTKMAFAGIKNEQDLADLLAYLATLSDKPEALPKENYETVIL